MEYRAYPMCVCDVVCVISLYRKALPYGTLGGSRVCKPETWLTYHVTHLTFRLAYISRDPPNVPPVLHIT